MPRSQKEYAEIAKVIADGVAGNRRFYLRLLQINL